MESSQHPQAVGGKAKLDWNADLVPRVHLCHVPGSRFSFILLEKSKLEIYNLMFVCIQAYTILVFIQACNIFIVQLCIRFVDCYNSIILDTIVIKAHKGYQIVPRSSKITRNAVLKPRGFHNTTLVFHVQKPSVQVWIVLYHGNI